MTAQSATIEEAVAEVAWESRFENFLAGGGDVVRDPTEADLADLKVPEGVAGARVPIPGLSHAADVDDVAPPGLRSHRLRLRIELRARGADRPDAGMMRMADEAEPGREGRKHFEPLLGGDQVVPLVRVVRARVDQRGVLHLQDERQPGQELAMRVVQNGGRPEGGRPRVGVEPPEVQTAGGPVLVVAGDQARPPLGELLDAGNRVGPVPNHIAQAKNGVRAADGEMAEDDGQSLEVCVNIRKKRVPDLELP